VRVCVNRISTVRLNLTTSAKTFGRCLNDDDQVPSTHKEFDFVINLLKDELNSRICLFIPPHVADYYESDKLVSDNVIENYEKASEEIRWGGTCLAAGLYTACVFHAMRAAEIGLRSINNVKPLKIRGNKPVERAEWREILDGLSTLIHEIENSDNTTPNKDDELQFFSEALAQFRFFKNGWRVRVAHARATYNEPQAKEALDHVRSFLEVLAIQLHE
jgi:hypothetical protein